METRLKEHQDDCRKGATEKSAVAEHAWSNQLQHPILWEETTMIDSARIQDCQHFNHDAVLELPSFSSDGSCYFYHSSYLNIFCGTYKPTYIDGQS